MEKCKKCSSAHTYKNGLVRGKQRYKCNTCGLNFTVDDRQNLRAKKQEIKDLAVQLYQLGLGFRAIGKFLGVSNVSVLNWVKKSRKPSTQNRLTSFSSCDGVGRNVALLQKKRKKVWCWLAICRDTKQLLAFELGTRGLKTGKKLWDKIKDIPCQTYCTDHWGVYQKLIPAQKHSRSKAETYTIESYNALFRHYVARFHRKTKCYSKSIQVIECSVLLLISHLNQKNKIKLSYS